MNTHGSQDVSLEPAGGENCFVRHELTGNLIGRVWKERNGEWWATFYLGEGRAVRNVSGGKFATQLDGVTAVKKAANLAA